MKTEPIKKFSLQQQVIARLRDEIMGRLRPEQQLDSEHKLAVRFDVSVRTVREALSALAHAGLVDRRHGKGTFVARRNARQHVALWLGTESVFPRLSYWTLRQLDCLEAFLSRQGVRSKIYWARCSPSGKTTGLGYEEFLSDVAQSLVVATGIVNGPLGHKVRRMIREKQIPVVWNSPPSCCLNLRHDPSQWGVGYDPSEVMRQAADRLLQQGCRKIAWMGWYNPRSAYDRATNPVYLSLTDLLAAHGLPVREHWLRSDLHPTLPGAGYAEFREIWSAEPEKPDGLLVTDDVLFQDVVTAILELRIPVPDQLKVVATANKGAVTCPFFPATRIEFDPEAQVQAMGTMLVKLARGDTTGPREVFLSFRWMPTADLTPRLPEGNVAIRRTEETKSTD